MTSDNRPSNSSKIIKPILVVGQNRSGTKWLANILCQHPDIYGTQAEQHNGIIETNLFGVMQRKFDLRFRDEYLAFIQLWSGTDFFKSAGASKAHFQQLTPQPTSFWELFREMAEYAAKKKKARYWVQKTSPLAAREALKHYPTAKVIIIRRGFRSTLRSLLKAREQRGASRGLLRLCWLYVFQDKLNDAIAGRKHVVEVYYESMKQAPLEELQRIGGYLELPFRQAHLETPFGANSSFSAETGSEDTPTERSFRLLERFKTLIEAFPLSIFLGIWKIREIYIRAFQPPQHIIRGTFRSTEAKIN